MKKILVTRPWVDAITTSRKLENLGFATTVCPLISLNKIKYNLENKFDPDLLIFSSKNSVRFFKGARYINKNVFSIGEGTLKELKIKKFKRIYNADGNAKKILEKFDQYYGKRKLKILHPCGTNIKKDFKDYFSMQGSKYLQLPVYSLKKQVKDPKLFKDFFENNGKIVTLFSQYTAESFIESLYKFKLDKIQSEIYIIGISKSILVYLKQYKFKDILISQKPNEKHLINILKKKF